MAKPRGNLDRPSIPKTAAAAAVPFAAVAEEPAQHGGSKSLTVKLSLRDYWALRDFCTQRERASGKRLTHQDAMIMGLHKLLEAAA
jgi:hypothetical protein